MKTTECDKCEKLRAAILKLAEEYRRDTTINWRHQDVVDGFVEALELLAKG